MALIQNCVLNILLLTYKNVLSFYANLVNHTVTAPDPCLNSPCVHGDCTQTCSGFTCSCHPNSNGTVCDDSECDKVPVLT